MVEILDIEPGSIARKLGIQPGDKLISIDQKAITDALDYRFYSGGEELELLIQQPAGRVIFEIEKDYQEDIGLILDDLEMRKCGNKCIFCFVHQNPKGLRKSLYFKDEDYRFSFLYGHYVTLSNASQQDLDRIVEQRLSPLYISVHATEKELRKYLLGIKFDDRLLNKIGYLTRNGIELNCQVVLCPRLNDGDHLDRTVTDLKRYYPAVRSIAIVPVGLTKHRTNLPELKPVTHQYSLMLIDEIDGKRRQLKKELGSSFVYLSDEFYIRTGRTLPEHNYYEGFYQLENGVGLTRDLIDRLADELPEIPPLKNKQHLTFATGKLGAAALERYFLPELNRIPNLDINLYSIRNYFYGESIEVAGLLTGEDLFHQLKRKNLGDYVVLPPRILNHDGVFLDDWTAEKLEGKLKRKIMIFPDSFLKLFSNIEKEKQAGTREEARTYRYNGPSLYVAEQMKGHVSSTESTLQSINDHHS
jgi:putative radical SAM enzyme (TIGR03279 family)